MGFLKYPTAEEAEKFSSSDAKPKEGTLIELPPNSLMGRIHFNATVTSMQFTNVSVQQTVSDVMKDMDAFESGAFAYSFQKEIAAFIQQKEQTQGNTEDDSTSSDTLDLSGDDFKEFLASLIDKQKNENEGKEYPLGLNNMKIYHLLMNKYQKNLSGEDDPMLQHYTHQNNVAGTNDPFSLDKYKDYANKSDEEKAELLAELEEEYPPGRSQILLNARVSAAQHNDPMIQKMVLDTMSNRSIAFQMQTFTASFSQMTFTSNYMSSSTDLTAQKSNLDFLERNTSQVEHKSFSSNFIVMVSEAYKMLQNDQDNVNLTEEDFKEYDKDALLNMSYSHEYISSYESFVASSSHNQNGSSFYTSRQSFSTYDYFSMNASMYNQVDEETQTA
jgi:hypothetical protein